MNLFIRIKDGQPFEHPIFLDNLRQAFPYLDINNLPPDFAVFERIELPVIGPYEMYEGTTYEWAGGRVKDVHHVRQLSEDEKVTKQQEAKDLWAASGGFPSWTFDEEICGYVPPSPRPDDGKNYYWDEEILSWVELAEEPQPVSE